MKFPSFKKRSAAGKTPEEKPQQTKASRGAGGKGSQTRLLVLLLLLVVLGVGASFYLGIIPGMPEPAQQAPVTQQVKRQAIAKPETSSVQKQAIPKPPESTQKPVAVVKPVPTKETKKVVEEQVPAQPVAAVASQPMVKKTVAATTAVPSVKPQPVTTVLPVKSADKPAVKKQKLGNYTVQVGTFLIPDSVKKARNVIRKLGFDPVVTDVRQAVNMTRLRADVYPDKAAAVARVKQLKSVAPDSFYLQVGAEYHVYVGSFFNIDTGRRFADHLYTRGILLEEEEVSIVKTLKQVSFGQFVEKKEADQAAAKARKKGLDAQVSGLGSHR
ncbi:MAG: SPOR domain-containing protein [Desulfuromonadaceae bacterium]|nr:SPOR domain-containing protein [Desulfuromonadaceae bacterium]